MPLLRRRGLDDDDDDQCRIKPVGGLSNFPLGAIHSKTGFLHSMLSIVAKRISPNSMIQSFDHPNVIPAQK